LTRVINPVISEVTKRGSSWRDQ